jgi:large subunit ribosomal protein L31
MREKIHPKWFPQAKMVCVSCGTEWIVGSTIPETRLDICANCHPFFTGEQRIVDTEGQVDRFLKRLQQRDKFVAETKEREEEKISVSTSVDALDIGKRYSQILKENGLDDLGKVIDALHAEGDEALLRYQGFGRKALADTKKRLRALGLLEGTAESSAE